jgi:Ulp1 family protease
VPIHDELHWSLALVCFPGGVGDPNRQQAILHLDSLRGMHRLTHIKPRLLCYLEEEWKEKQKEKLQVGYRVLRFRVLRL